MASSLSPELRWLYSTQQFGIKLGLQNMQRLLKELDHPEDASLWIHVAGTNGKGSVCAFLDSLLRAGEYSTGLYTSPHLIHFRERIQIQGIPIPEADLAEGICRLKRIISGWDPSPTFFELSTALALRYFAEQGIRVGIIETGMGGRLDATNVIVPQVSVVTPIGREHTQWLGNTLAAIAAEKAGIFKPQIPACSAIQVPEVHQVLKHRTHELAIPLHIATQPLEKFLTRLPRDPFHQHPYHRTTDSGSSPTSDSSTPITLGLPGNHQRDNAALALLALEVAGYSISLDQARQGLQDVQWPGRFQRHCAVILDGAHNAHGVEQLKKTWQELYPNTRPVIVFGVLKDKNYPQMLEILADFAYEFWFVALDNDRAANPCEVSEQVPDVEHMSSVRIFDSTFELFQALEEEQAWVPETRSAPPRFLITGSLVLVGEILGDLERKGYLKTSRRASSNTHRSRDEDERMR